MTMDRPVRVVEDTHPRRPSIIESMARHLNCCLEWRTCAGHCSPELIDTSGGGMTFTQAGEWESGSAQKIDWDSAFKKLPWLHQRVMRTVADHGPIDIQGGDPGYYLNGKRIPGFDGQDFTLPEVFWRHYQTSIGNYHWTDLADIERQAYEKMARSLGWKPVEG